MLINAYIDVLSHQVLFLALLYYDEWLISFRKWSLVHVYYLFGIKPFQKHKYISWRTPKKNKNMNKTSLNGVISVPKEYCKLSACRGLVFAAKMRIFYAFFPPNHPSYREKCFSFLLYQVHWLAVHTAWIFYIIVQFSVVCTTLASSVFRSHILPHHPWQ